VLLATLGVRAALVVAVVLISLFLMRLWGISTRGRGRGPTARCAARRLDADHRLAFAPMAMLPPSRAARQRRPG
jgi:hypothetical protein